ncbi:response regulator [Cohnella hongkongensis]|uniref:Response regulator n=1 Tax=Cohnella hongkongensis TaxID=178337 RepID=A0ABV9FJC0_9BACL
MDIKVFVVDDEERQRNAIIRHVDWKRYHMRVTGQAEDAGAAIELARQNVPDLLVTDIRMHGVSGLELSARMRELNARLRVIVVTGYEEFEYAKSALDIGVDAFLVKPIRFEELAAILERISQSEQQELSRMREDMRIKEQLDAFKPIAREQLLQEAMHGLIIGEEAIRARADALGMFARKGLRRVFVIVIDPDTDATCSREEQIARVGQAFGKTASHVCGPLLEERMTTQRGNIVLILQQQQDGADFERETELLLGRLGHEAARIEGCIISLGAGPVVDTLSQLSRSFLLAQRAVNRRLLGNGERTFSWRDLHETGHSPDKSAEELIGDFFEVFAAGDSQSSLSLLGEIVRRIAGNLQIDETGLRSLCLQLISGANRIAAEIGDVSSRVGPEKKLWEQILACREEPELLQETVRIITGLCDFVADKKKSPSQVVVQNALDYMHKHYSENLSLRSVADSVFLSPNYLGALFRSELGVSFTDQLIQIRVNKAKELLRQPQLKLYEVAESVGYQNIGYFTNLFKRMTGFSPKEYRAYLGISQQD